jgi:hypothetical protein
MSFIVHALALFPAVAVAIVGLVVFADRRDTAALNALRMLDQRPDERDELTSESYAA